ncbi:MAG: trehalose-6-phosphate synthase [Candidatus Binatia bacterium]
MRRAIGFLISLLAGLAVLTLAGYFALQQVTGQWFAKDLRLRAELAVAAARQSLAEHWTEGPAILAANLRDITRDERILGAAACAVDGSLLAATEAYPQEFSCKSILQRMRADNIEATDAWTISTELPAGRVQLSAVPLQAGDRALGVVLLVHDLEFVSRRETTMMNILLAAFFTLSLGASLVTLVAARLAWKGWTSDLHRALAGQENKRFQPLLRDVRALVETLDTERKREAHSGPWDAARLRATLKEHLQGERIVVLANREPWIHERIDGELRVLHPASGLVTALEPVMRACSGVWVAHGSGSADRETADATGHVRVPPGEESYVVRRVWLSEEEENGFYYGFSNEGLWPLCHVADARPQFRADDWDHYVRVNRRFADAVCEEVDSDDPIILVQDYHFALAPRMIREKLPRATILTFWHIPWPSAERIGICPWAQEVITGLLGSSIVAFHTQQHCNHFIDAVDALVESRIDREATAVVQGTQRTLVRAYPISIEWPVRWLRDVPPPPECRRSVTAELGLTDDVLIGIGVDRLDYTKGIEERLQAVDTMLELYPEFRGRFTFIQLAAPSRTKILRYRELNERIEALAEQINARWAGGRNPAVILRRFHHEPVDVFRYFRAADVCYVSSLHDGMNLAAKEFVAAREDGRGVLVLSQFTGAARDLTEALIVNPYDPRQAGEALAAALRMPPDEQRERMESMRRMVSEFNVYRWAGRMLIDAAEVRRRERMTGRLTTTGIPASGGPA